MKNLLILPLWLLCHLSFGQESKLISKEETKLIEKDGEEYEVLKSDNKVRHGSYVKYKTSFTGKYRILETGHYSQGQRTGLWETYFEWYQSIRERGHYANGKKNGVWTYYYPDTTRDRNSIEKMGQKNKTDSLVITLEQKDIRIKRAGMYLNDKKVGVWSLWDYDGKLVQQYNFTKGILLFDSEAKDSTQLNVNHGPIYTDVSRDLNELTKDFSYGKFIDKVKGDSVVALITFTVDVNGKTKDIQVTSTPSIKTLDNELANTIPLTDGHWIPGLKDGVRTESTVTLRFKLRKTQRGRNFDIRALIETVR